jgi:hypothetical protein
MLATGFWMVYTYERMIKDSVFLTEVWLIMVSSEENFQKPCVDCNLIFSGCFNQPFIFTATFNAVDLVVPRVFACPGIFLFSSPPQVTMRRPQSCACFSLTSFLPCIVTSPREPPWLGAISYKLLTFTFAVRSVAVHSTIMASPCLRDIFVLVPTYCTVVPVPGSWWSLPHDVLGTIG